MVITLFILKYVLTYCRITQAHTHTDTHKHTHTHTPYKLPRRNTHTPCKLPRRHTRARNIYMNIYIYIHINNINI